jgi:hypothetical protein
MRGSRSARSQGAKWVVVVLNAIFYEFSFANELSLLTNQSANHSPEIHTRASLNTLESEDVEYTAYGGRIMFDYFVWENVALEAAYANLNDVQKGSTLWDGFDFGLRWYLQSAGARVEHNMHHVTVTKDSRFTHYFSFWHRGRTIHGEVDVSYSGYGLGVGGNYALFSFGKNDSERAILSLELSADRFTGYNKATILSRNVEIGLGFRIL